MSTDTVSPSALTQGSAPSRRDYSFSTLQTRQPNSSTDQPELTPSEWIARARRRAENPLSRRHLASSLQMLPESIYCSNASDAESLGQLLGLLQNTGLVNLGLAHGGRVADWHYAFIVGLASAWPSGLPTVVRDLDVRGMDPTMLLPALVRCLSEAGTSARPHVLEALDILASNGHVGAFQALERDCLSAVDGAEESRTELFARLALVGCSALKSSAAALGLQDRVDIAVALTDVGAKVGAFELVDRIFDKLSPEELPIEVSTALLATTGRMTDSLPLRKGFRDAFQKDLTTRRYPEAEKLLRHLR
jgi:hypothetical protein